MKKFDFADGLTIWQRNLPHWRQEGAMYFVTWRLADALPADKLRQLTEERRCWATSHHIPYTPEEQRQYHYLFSERVQKWLDAGYGGCVMRRPTIKEIVADALNYFNGNRYDLDAWVVMPNHVHVLVEPRQSHRLDKITYSWMHYTSRRINKLRGSTDQVWQHEPYDHIVRNETELDRIRSYIHNHT